MTFGQIIDFVVETFQKTVTKGWVHSVVFRYKDDLAKTVIDAIDESSLKVSRRFLKEF